MGTACKQDFRYCNQEHILGSLNEFVLYKTLINFICLDELYCFIMFIERNLHDI